MEQTGRGDRRAARLRMGVVRTGQLVSTNAKRLAASSDVLAVAAGFDSESEAESADRTFRLPLRQDELIQEMAAANKNTIVVMTSGGGVDMNAWRGKLTLATSAGGTSK